MASILSEKEYQKFILEKLKENGYEIQESNKYDRFFAIDRQELFRFLNATQPETMEKLYKIHKTDTEDTIINLINNEETKKRGSRLEVLKHGIEISNEHLDLLYTKPATSFNKDLVRLYDQNIFSVSEEVWASDKERIDIVVFINGLAIATFELKCNMAGQSYKDAITQYRTKRNSKTRLFRFKSGALVHFAMDLEQVYMATKIDGKGTFFLPFNMGNGTGVDAGAGNPILEDDYSVHYMWDNIFTKDSIIEIITKFMFIEVQEKPDELKGKTNVTETVIFPRYHQLDVLRKILEDVKVNKTSQNYLLQHSAGSGKTNEIAWLAHRLASLHDEDNKIIYDNIIICTDRVVVDRQLQNAVLHLEHKSGFIKVMDDKCTSADLANALSGNTKIIGTTIQKFPYIVDAVSNMKDKNFAVIIDEAHSSTAGKNMSAVTYVLSGGELTKEEADVEDVIANEITRNGKQKNVSMFAFTATPKPTTLQLFGRVNPKGRMEAFHIYSMKQAIEEGFILDVLQNYITYQTYFQLNKAIADDPELQTNPAKRQIARFVELHETNIAQKIEIIVEHFRTCVMSELGGTAKAMVVTASREAAVKYRQAFEDYVNKKGYKNIHALVAFSGTVTLKENGKEYTEVGMNGGIAEKNLPEEFNKDEYQVLLVANKYQTGFDQKKLCAMYILKTLRGVATVQTLSRLNRICPPYNKKTFILDFVNDYDSIVSDFSKYYTTTLLSNAVTPSAVYDIEARIDGYNFLDSNDIERFNDLLYKEKNGEKITSEDKKEMTFLLSKAKRRIYSGRTTDDRSEIFLTILHFIRFYEFLLQASCFEDTELHKKYNFLTYLQSMIDIGGSGFGFDLNGKIAATGFTQTKTGEHKTTQIDSDPVTALPEATQIIVTEEKQEKLSKIIEEINSRTGKSYDNDVAIKAMLQIKDIVMKSAELKASAQNNTEKDFEFAYFDNIDDALIEGLTQNQDFFTLLLQNDELKKEVLGIFIDEIYNSLKGSKK